MAENQGTVLPRNVTQEAFDAAIAQFKRALGEENVLLQSPQLAPYRKMMMPVDVEEFAPSAAVVATTVEQVQEVVRICNEHKIPVWTISTGQNLGYGTAVPHH